MSYIDDDIRNPELKYIDYGKKDCDCEGNVCCTKCHGSGQVERTYDDVFYENADID